MKNFKWPSPEILLVLGLAYVFLSFGIQKIIMTDHWIGWMPVWMEGLMGMSMVTWTKMVGAIEIIFGVGLIIPKTRTIAAVLMALHLLPVLYVTRFSDIGVRDTGLLLMTLSILALRLKK